MSLLQTQAPAFSLSDQTGHRHNLADYRGKWVILYFYPADDTPYCTIEACDFRDRQKELCGLGVVTMGVSHDTIDSHISFASKYVLPFPLLADPSHSMIEAYKAWGISLEDGKEIWETQRITYIIDPTGKIVKEYNPVNHLGHAQQVLTDVSRLIEQSNVIAIDDFAKCDVRVGLVTTAIAVPNSKKLIQLSVDLGPEIGIRTILTGMLPYYPDPSVFANKKFLFLVNLAPRKMAGIESQGMFLAPDDGVKPTLVELPPDTAVGARVH